MSGAVSSIGSVVSSGVSTVGSLFSVAGPTAERGVGGIPLPVARPTSGISSLFSGVADIVKGAAPFIQVGATAFQAQSRITQSVIERDAAEFNAQVADRDAALATFSAGIEAKDVRRENIRRMKSIRAAFAKGGVSSTSGSALTVQLEAAEQGELEAQKVLFAGQLRSDAARIRATQERARGRSAIAAGRTSAGGTLLGGIRNLIR